MLDDFWYTRDPLSGFVYGGRSAAGMNVTAETAMTLAAVYRAVRLLADDIAALPLHLYRWLPERADGLPGGKERVRDDLAHVIGAQPNPRQTSFEWRQQKTASLLLRGNGYSRIVGGRRGFMGSLEPLAAARVRPEILDSGRVLYLYRSRTGGEVRFNQEDILHLRGFNPDPESAEGLSVIGLARTSLGLSMATEEFGASQFSGTPRPSFAITSPTTIDKTRREELSKGFRDAWSSPSGWGGVPVMDNGMTVAKIGMSHDDAQFLQTRQFQVADVARWFGVPPHMIGDLSRATFSNIEQQSLDYVAHSLASPMALWTQTLKRDVILDDDVFAEFELGALLRGEALKRAQSYQLLANMKAITPNEIRARENMNPVPWGDEPLQPQGAPPAPESGAARDEEDDAAERGANGNRVEALLNGRRR